MVPMLDTVMVPPPISSGDRWLVWARTWSLWSSRATCMTLLLATSFTLGTTSPKGVFIAQPMLCLACCTMALLASSTLEFITGKSSSASESALSKNGIIVSLAFE